MLGDHDGRRQHGERRGKETVTPCNGRSKGGVAKRGTPENGHSNLSAWVGHSRRVGKRGGAETDARTLRKRLVPIDKGQQRLVPKERQTVTSSCSRQSQEAQLCCHQAFAKVELRGMWTSTCHRLSHAAIITPADTGSKQGASADEAPFRKLRPIESC